MRRDQRDGVGNKKRLTWYPMYKTMAVSAKPDTLDAASKLENPAPTILKNAVMTKVVRYTINQFVKNAVAVACIGINTRLAHNLNAVWRDLTHLERGHPVQNNNVGSYLEK
jgi:hypothetical protein